jgi:hypothetical protein
MNGRTGIFQPRLGDYGRCTARHRVGDKTFRCSNKGRRVERFVGGEDQWTIICPLHGLTKEEERMGKENYGEGEDRDVPEEPYRQQHDIWCDARPTDVHCQWVENVGMTVIDCVAARRREFLSDRNARPRAHDEGEGVP